MNINGTTSGTLFTRKLRGWKLSFIMGGPCANDAPKFINWGNIYKNGLNVIHVSEAGAFIIYEDGQVTQTVIDPRNHKE